LIVARDHVGMVNMIETTEPPTGRVIEFATYAPVGAAARREGQARSAPGEAARELDAEVTRLLRVRGGELAEPLLWKRPSQRREVEAIVAHLAPIRSRIALLSSWERESRRGPALRLAYAIVWLRLAQRRAGEYGPRNRPEARRRVLTAGG
jgi:hypothetical protein